jgi:hypothetical protein
MFRGRCRAALFSTILFLGLHASVAQAAGSDSDAWQFEITPYLFASGLEGTAGVQGVTANIDMSFGDIFENLDSGFLALFEARKRRWIFGLDTIYMKLKVDGNRSWQGPLGNGNSAALDVTMTQQMYQPFVGYRLLDERTKLDLIAGARYTQLDLKFALSVPTGSPLLPDGSRGKSGSESWWDPIVGVRVVTPIADNWSFVGYADVGGGGGSDSTYQLLAGVNWQFAKDFSGKFGYRYLVADYENDGLVWDMKSSGLYTGLGIAF